MLAFQNALNEREQQLEQQQSKYSKLKHAFQELQDTSNTQNRLICSIVDNLVPYAQTNGLNPCCWTGEAILDVLDFRSQDAVNVGSLQDQIRLLQREMLAKVDTIYAGPDD